MAGLVDVHSHFLPEWYAEEAIRCGHETPDGMPFWPAWTASAHLGLMDAIGVERSLLSLSTPGVALAGAAANRDLARRVNQHAAGVVEEHPDRFGFLASLPLPDVDAALAEAARALDELGADGVILQTSSLGTYVTDPSHEPLWALLAEREAVVLLHPTSPPGWETTALGLPRPLMEFLFDTTRVVVGLLLGGTLQRHRGVRLVVPHSGSVLPLLVDRAEMFQTGMRMLLPPDHPVQQGPELTAALGDLWWDLAGTPTPTHLGGLLDRGARDRLVYGSDFCFTPPHAVEGQIALLDRSWPGTGEPGPWRDLVTANVGRLLSCR
jgi:predicted TIM-barrel fold metal-dependent hydrolase